MEPQNKQRIVKCVIVGDGGAGKYTLAQSYATNMFSQTMECSETAEPYVGPYTWTGGIKNIIGVTVEGVISCELHIYSTPGQEDYDRLRPDAYPDTDVILVCFVVVSENSFSNVSSRWIPEIRHFCPTTPFLLVGLKTDLRELPGESFNHLGGPVTIEAAQLLANELGAVKYMECSALRLKGVHDVFAEAIMACIDIDSYTMTFTHGMKHGHVNLTTKKLVLMGAPCVGKTAFKALLFNWSAPRHHHSTAIASRPVRAIERVTERNNGKNWDIVESPEVLSTITNAMKEIKLLSSLGELIKPNIGTNWMRDGNEVHFVGQKRVMSIVNDPSSLKSDFLSANNKDYKSTVLNKMKKSGKAKHRQIHKATWIHVLDSGGQPQFTDTSRAFLRGNAINMIVVKLTEKLSDKPRFTYSLNGKVINAPKELQMTNIQLIKHFVCSASVSKTTTITIGGAKIVTKPFFIIIGTYYDEAMKGIFNKKEIIEETIADKNKEILSELREFRDHLIFYNYESEELIFPVDNLCQWNRKQISSQIRNRIMAQKGVGFKVPIPIRWYMFELHMRDIATKTEHGIISLETCQSIGASLDMNHDEVQASLVYFDSLTLCLYYEKILPNVIFTNPQYLLDLLSNIVRLSFVSTHEDILPEGHSMSFDTQQLLCEDGIFEKSLLDIAGLSFVPPFFTKRDFLLLLQHISVIAPIKSPDFISRYFMPVVLSTDQMTKEQKQLISTAVQPLVITFGGKVVLQGFFPTLVVTLLSRNEEPRFCIDSQSDNFPRQLRHAVKLYSDDLFGSVFLCDEYNSIEVYFTGRSKYCYLLRQVLLQAISASAATLAYDEDSLNTIALVRCTHKHLSAINDEKVHPITICYRDSPPIIGCSVEDLPVIELTDERQSCWLIEPIDHSSMAIPAALSNVIPEGTLSMEHISVVLLAVKIINKWELLGIYLGLKFSTIEEIRRNNHHQVEPSRKDMIVEWLKGGTATGIKLALAFEAMGKKRSTTCSLPNVSSSTDESAPSLLSEEILDEGHLSTILTTIRDINGWEKLGIHLGIEYPLLERIKEENPFDIETSRMIVIVKWIQKGTATCQKLMSALEIMGKVSVAIKVKQLIIE